MLYFAGVTKMANELQCDKYEYGVFPNQSLFQYISDVFHPQCCCVSDSVKCDDAEWWRQLVLMMQSVTPRTNVQHNPHKLLIPP